MMHMSPPELKATDSLYLLKQRLSRSNILSLLQHYGFLECGNVISFLEYVCDAEMLDRSAYSYIYAKMCECLLHHDTGDYGDCDDFYYFETLRRLRGELEFILSVKQDAK
ncbi:Uncharacterised protein [Klebsiella pneumoniae]|nr:Uncharacterised protein [Klebsiella pneumoniae]